MENYDTVFQGLVFHQNNVSYTCCEVTYLILAVQYLQRFQRLWVVLPKFILRKYL